MPVPASKRPMPPFSKMRATASASSVWPGRERKPGRRAARASATENCARQPASSTAKAAGPSAAGPAGSAATSGGGASSGGRWKASRICSGRQPAAVSRRRSGSARPAARPHERREQPGRGQCVGQGAVRGLFQPQVLGHGVQPVAVELRVQEQCASRVSNHGPAGAGRPLRRASAVRNSRSKATFWPTRSAPAAEVAGSRAYASANDGAAAELLRADAGEALDDERHGDAGIDSVLKRSVTRRRASTRTAARSMMRSAAGSRPVVSVSMKTSEGGVTGVRIADGPEGRATAHAGPGRRRAAVSPGRRPPRPPRTPAPVRRPSGRAAPRLRSAVRGGA